MKNVAWLEQRTTDFPRTIYLNIGLLPAASPHPDRCEESLARTVGRPRKLQSAKARRVMISMAPNLIKAAGIYAKRTGHTLSGLIAQSLEEKIRRKAS